MDPRLARDRDDLPKLLESTRIFAEQPLAGLDERPVVTRRETPPVDTLPKDGVVFEGALARFAERWEPGFSGSAGPRYLGFVTGGVTPAALAADWLAGVYDQNVV